jgi:hypothetical protein
MLSRFPIILVAGTCALGGCDRNPTKDHWSQSSNPVTNTNATVNAPTSTNSLADFPAAKNAAQVSRFDDEVPLTPTRTRLVATPSTARAMPLGAKAIAVFTNGGEVTELAQKGNWYLTVFADPADANTKLAGWIYKDAIVGVAATATGSNVSCKPSEVRVQSDGICATPCTLDADCVAVGGVCDGNTAATKDPAGSRLRYCVVPARSK